MAAELSRRAFSQWSGQAAGVLVADPARAMGIISACPTIQTRTSDSRRGHAAGQRLPVASGEARHLDALGYRPQSLGAGEAHQRQHRLARPPSHGLWQGGPYGPQTKRRIIPLSPRVQPLLEGHFVLHDTLGMAPRTIQMLAKRMANRARISRPVTPHVLRHTF